MKPLRFYNFFIVSLNFETISLNNFDTFHERLELEAFRLIAVYFCDTYEYITVYSDMNYSESFKISEKILMSAWNLQDNLIGFKQE